MVGLVEEELGAVGVHVAEALREWLGVDVALSSCRWCVTSVVVVIAAGKCASDNLGADPESGGCLDAGLDQGRERDEGDGCNGSEGNHFC